MSGAPVRKRVIVHGDVQGVGFRFNARSTAAELGVSGYARNRLDGTVEAEIEGDEASVARMLAWLASGPRFAHVSSLDVEDVEPVGQPGFDIRR